MSRRMSGALALLLALLLLAPGYAQTPSTFTGRTGAPAAQGDPIKLNEMQAASAAKRDTASAPEPQDYVVAAMIASVSAGTMNAAPAINMAMLAGKGVTLPCGTYRLDGPLNALTTDGGAIRGLVGTCAKLQANFATGDVITVGTVGAAGNGVRGIRISGITMTTAPGVTHTSGAAINVGSHYDLDVGNVTIDGAWAGGEIVVHGATGVSGGGAISRLHHLWLGAFSGSTGNCLYLTDYAVDTYIDQVNTNDCATALLIDNASGIYLSNMDLYGSVYGAVTVAPGSGQNVNALYASNVLGDSGGGTAWYFGGTGAITDTHLTNAWGSGSGGTGAGFGLVNSNINGFTAMSLHAHHNGGHGIQITAGTNIKISDPQVWNNNVSGQSGSSCVGSPVYDGISVTGSASVVLLSGVQSGLGGYMGLTAGLPNCQRYGVDIESTGYTVLSGGASTNNRTSPVNVGSGAYAQISNVIGFNTKNHGTGSIATSAACGAVALGLASTIPDAAISVTFTPTATYTTGPLYLQSVSGGTATVCGTSATSGAIPFRWTATAYEG